MKQFGFLFFALVICVPTAYAAPDFQQIKSPQFSNKIVLKPYQATLKKPISAPKTVLAGKLKWQCNQSECTSSGTVIAPSKADCAQLAKKVGPLLYCGKKNAQTQQPFGVKPVRPNDKPTSTERQPQNRDTTQAPSGPRVITTRPLEVIGNPNLPGASEPFTPKTIDTGALEVIGNPTLPQVEGNTFKPKTINTSPLEVIGTPTQ